MAISADYPHPVNVNGFQCKNCTDVDYAKKHIDPAHPKEGPFGINKQDDAVKFGGRLSDLNATAPNAPISVSQPTQIIDVRA